MSGHLNKSNNDIYDNNLDRKKLKVNIYSSNTSMSRLVKVILTNSLQANITSFINLLKLYLLRLYYQMLKTTRKKILRQ